VLDAFADRADRRIGGAHLVVNHHAAPDLRPAARARAVFGRMPTAMTSRSQGRVRPSFSFRPATLPFSPTISSETAASSVATPRRPGRWRSRKPAALVELALHQHVHQVDDRRAHAPTGQAVGGFQAEQAAADHHGARARLGRGGDHRLDVVEVAEGDHALQVEPGSGRRKGSEPVARISLS
jgi:hypothetical protein